MPSYTAAEIRVATAMLYRLLHAAEEAVNARDALVITGVDVGNAAAKINDGVLRLLEAADIVETALLKLGVQV